MKLYISADIEGISGVCDWDAANRSGSEYTEACKLMTGEVLAACRGAEKAGFDEIVIKDAHGSGRNIIPSLMPESVTLIRSWSGHPYSMMQEINNSFDAALMIGYHGGAGTGSNPLAHSFNGKVASLKINDKLFSEFSLNTMISWYEKVPVAFVSGDESVCREAESYQSDIMTHAVSKGIGMSSVSKSHSKVCADTETLVEEALSRFPLGSVPETKGPWKLEVCFNTPYSAYNASFYPGVQWENEVTVSYESDDFFEILRARKFIL